jgi:hypothetical protein
MEARKNGDQCYKRLDILLRNGTDTDRYGFELMVDAIPTNFNEHCDRTTKYVKMHECAEVYVVNLRPKPNSENRPRHFGLKFDKVVPVLVEIDHQAHKGMIRYDEYHVNEVAIRAQGWDIAFDSQS